MNKMDRFGMDIFIVLIYFYNQNDQNEQTEPKTLMIFAIFYSEGFYLQIFLMIS